MKKNFKEQSSKVKINFYQNKKEFVSKYETKTLQKQHIRIHSIWKEFSKILKRELIFKKNNRNLFGTWKSADLRRPTWDDIYSSTKMNLIIRIWLFEEKLKIK